MEPRPLLEEDATEIEEALLRAGRDDGPPAEATAHLLAVMQALPSAPGVPGSGQSSLGDVGTASVKPAGLVRWVKMGLLTIAVGGVVPATHYFARTHESSPPADPGGEETRPTVAPVQAPAPGKALPAREIREILPEAGREDPRLAVGEASPRRRKASPAGRIRGSAGANDSSLDGSLGNETRALDRAREALDASRPSQAMQRLDEYHRRFPQGRLRPEAMVLRLAVLVQTGRRGAAEALADQLLADQDYQAYVPRIRSLLGTSKP